MLSPKKSLSSKRSTFEPSRTPAGKSPEGSTEEPMNWKKIFAVMRREYVERVRTKAFWIGTLLIPGLLLALIGFQIALSHKASGDRRLAVLDLTGSLFAPLQTELDAQEREHKAKDPNARLPHWIL